MMKMKKVIITLTICFILFPHFVFADGDPEIMPWLRVLGKAWINGDLVVNGSITGGTIGYTTVSFQSIVTPSGDLTITPVGDDVLLDGGLTVGSSTQAGDNNLRVEGNAAIVGSVTTDDLYLQDTDASHTLNVHWNENEASANRTLNLAVVGGTRTFTMNQSLTVGSGNDGTLTYSAASKTLTVEDNVTIGLDVNALEGLSSTGVVTRTAANTYSERTITGTASEVEVTNGDGVSGNPTIGLPDDVSIESDLTINPTVTDTENPVVHYYYDADSDGGATSNGHLSINGTAASNPANSYITLDANDVGLGLKIDGHIGVNTVPVSSSDISAASIKLSSYLNVTSYIISNTGGFYSGNVYRGSISVDTQTAGGANPWMYESGGLTPSVATGGNHTFYVDDTTAVKIDSTRHIVLYSESNPGTLSNAEWYLTQGDQMNFASASGGYNFDGTINTMNMSNGVTGEVTNWNTVKNYNDSTITAETTLTDVLPAGYAIDKIIFKNTTANAITNLDIGFTDGGGEIVGANNISASDEGSFTINQQIDDFDAADTIYISASNWNSANLIIYIRMVRMF